MWTEAEKTEVTLSARIVDVQSGEIVRSGTGKGTVSDRTWTAFWFAKLGKKNGTSARWQSAAEKSADDLAENLSK